MAENQYNSKIVLSSGEVLMDLTQDTVVADKLLNGIHIGSLGSHIDVDKLNSERLADSEMAVISGHCTDKLDILLMRPRLLNADCAVEHEPCKLVVHDIERGVACNNDICGGDAENV